MTSFFHTRIHLATPGRQRYKKQGTQARPPRKSGEFIVSKKAFVSAERNRFKNAPGRMLLAQPASFCPRAAWTQLLCELGESWITQIALEGIIFGGVRDALAGIRVGLVLERQF